MIDACLAAQSFPEDEESVHNFIHPDECVCMPEVWEYYGLDGEVDFTIVEHKWVQ